MTKQTKTYLLLFVTLIVWGLIGFRIYKSFRNDNNIVASTNFNQTFTPKKIKKSEIYTVNANYRDPFLGKFPNTTKKKKKPKKKAPKKKTNIRFPKIIYNGIVEGGNVKSYTITINGKQELLTIGQTINDITLINASNDEISVRYKEVTKKIPLE